MSDVDDITSEASAARELLHKMLALDPVVLQHRERALVALRDTHGPVVWSDEAQGFFVLGYDECMEVLHAPEIFSSMYNRGKVQHDLEQSIRTEVTQSAEMADLRACGYGADVHPRALSDADPPLHTRQRRLVARPFLPGRVKSLEEPCRAIADTLIDDLATRRRSEFVSQYTQPLIARTGATLLMGLPEEHVPTYTRWADASLVGSGKVKVSDEERQRMIDMRKEFDRYFIGVIDDRRANPRDDFMTDFVLGAAEGDDPLTIDEMLAGLLTLIRGTQEASSKALASMVILLAEHPDLQDELRGNDPLIEVFIEEAVRMETPAGVMGRLAVADTEIAGVPIPAGSYVLVSLASAGFDPTQCPAPETIDFDRSSPRAHLGYGHGIHYCVGHAIARMMMSIGVGMVLDRLGSLRFVGGDDRSVVPYSPSFGLRGPAELWLDYEVLEPPARADA